MNLPAVAYSFEPNEPLGYCRLRSTPGGATIELRDILRKASTPGETLSLTWRRGLRSRHHAERTRTPAARSGDETARGLTLSGAGG